MIEDKILVVLDPEQADVIKLALDRFRTYLYEGGITGIRNEQQVQFVDNLIYYIKERMQIYEYKVKDGMLVPMIDMLPEDREAFVGFDYGLGEDGE